MDRFDEFLNNKMGTRKRDFYPFYSDASDYNTNAKSYYDDLAKKEHLFRILAHRIWEYDEELAKRFEEWDRLIENFPEDVKKLLQKWLEDGTLKDIINEEIFEDLNNLINALSVRVGKNENDIENLKKLDYKTRKVVYQRYAMNMDLGNDDNPLFDGSNKANQGIAYIKHSGKEYVFTRSRVEGSGWDEDELSRISIFEFNDNQLSVKPIHVSKPLRIGHQGLSAYVDSEDGLITLITSVYNNKGYSKIKWRGDDTCQDDVKEFVLLRDNTENDPLSTFYHLTPTCDANGEFIVLSGSTKMASPLRYVLVYRSKDIECKTDYLKAKPLNVFKIDPPPYINGNVVQDLACDDSFIYILQGYNDELGTFNITTYGYTGNPLGHLKVDLSKNRYTHNDWENNNLTIEPEGLTIRNNQLLAQCVNNEKVDCCMENHKYIYELFNYKKDKLCEPINSGIQPFEAPSNLHLHGNGNDISWNKGDALNFSSYDFSLMKFYNQIKYSAEHLLTLADARDGADNEQNMVFGGYYKEDEQFAIIRSDRSNAHGSGFNLETSRGKNNGTITFITPSHRLYFSGNEGHLRPSTDGEQDIGSSGYHWDNGYIDNVQSTSDKRYKKDIVTSDLGLDFINKINPVKYKYKNGERDHYGIIAQELKQVIDELGIDFGGYQDHNIKNNEDKLTVGYMEFIAPLIKSVQELSQEVEELKKELGK